MGTNEVFIAAGYRFLHYGIYANGFLIGNTTSGPSEGAQAGQGMLRLRGASTLPLQSGADNILEIEGDDVILGTFDFEGSLPAGAFQMTSQDLTFEAVALGTLVDTIGDLTIGAQQPSDTNKADLTMLAQRRAKKDGESYWESKIIVVCTITPLGSEFNTRAEGPFNYSINLQKATNYPWGPTFSESNIGTENLPILTVQTPNPIHIHAARGDGAATDYDLLYTPVAAAKVYPYVNRVSQPAFTLSGKTVQFSSAPATGSYIEVLYEFDEGDLS